MPRPYCGAKTLKGPPCRYKANPSIHGGYLPCDRHIPKYQLTEIDDQFGTNRQFEYELRALITEEMKGRDNPNFRTQDSEGNQIVTVDTGDAYTYSRMWSHPLMIGDKVYLPYDRIRVQRTVVSMGTSYTGELLQITQRVR